MNVWSIIILQKNNFKALQFTLIRDSPYSYQLKDEPRG